MNEENIRRLLFNTQISVQRASYAGSKAHTRWLNISCPFAPYTHASGTDNNPSFGITIKDDARSSYKCLSCQMKGSLAQLPSIIGGYRKIDYSKQRQWAELTEITGRGKVELPSWEGSLTIERNEVLESKIPNPSKLFEFPRVYGHSYLRSRGITFPTTAKLGLRYDAWQRRILFPVYDAQGRYRGLTGRSIKNRTTWPKNDPKVRDYHGLNKREIFLDLPGEHAGPRIITEGLFDYGKLVSLGYYNSKAILGTSLTPEKIEQLKAAGDPVLFWMDDDVAGWTALFGMFDENDDLKTDNAWAFQLWREIPVWIIPWPGEPMQGRDPGALSSKKQAEAFLRHAWVFTGQAPLDRMNNRLWRLPKRRVKYY